MAHSEAVGIFSQTLSSSSCVKWILPAKIRSKSQNDVVFVGETSIHLREALPNGRLGDVVATTELDAHILAAKVISAKHERIPVVEQIFNQTIEDERERYIINEQEIDDATPPQIVALSLSTNELMLVFAHDEQPGWTKFLYAKKPFLRAIAMSERFGSQLAIDPESRAVATSTITGFVAISSLKQIDEIQAEVRQANSNTSHIFKATSQDRFLQIDGLIQKMEFLPSTSTDPNKILLLLLVASAGRTSMLLYRWDNREGPKSARPMMCSGQKLPVEDSMALMLIPSSRCPSFVIVTEHHLAVYDNVISDQAKRVKFPCVREVPGNFESSSSPPGWVAWAKPRRHEPYLEKHDDFYLVREDGELRYYIIDHDSPMKVEAHFSPGSLNISVDTAFAMLIAPKELGADVFVAGGDLSDGGVWHCVARQSPVCVQVIPNMAPLRDMLITQPRKRLGLGLRPTRKDATKLFTCSGKHSRFSFVNEIRFGLEAEIGCSIEYEDVSTATNLWILQDLVDDRALFLLSHPMNSSLLSLDPITLDIRSGDADTYPGIDLGSPTLAAAHTAQGLTIQICPDGINLCVIAAGGQRKSTKFRDATCIAAAIEVKSGRFVLALRSSEGFCLQMGSTTMKMDILLENQPYDVSQELSAVTISLLGDACMVVAGLDDGTLLILCAHPGNRLQLLSHYSIQKHLADALSFTISSVEVLCRRGALQGLILCGLRSGLLAIVSFNMLEEPGRARVDTTFCETVQIGSTRVQVTIEQGSDLVPKGAFISSDGDLSRVALLDEADLQYRISPVWFTDRDKPSSTQPNLNAVCRIIDNHSADINGLLVCASENELLISSLLIYETMVPRRHRIKGPPEKLTYLKSLKKLVVAFNTIDKVATFQSHSKPAISRRFRPALELVDPESVSAEEPDVSSILHVGGNGDRIRAITEFLPTDGMVHFEFLAIGIDRDAPDHHHPSGQLIFVTLAHMNKMPFSAIKPKTIKTYASRPVNSLHPFGLDRILVGAGKDVVWEQFDVKLRKLITLRTFSLPSSAISLHAIDSLVYAATTSHSLIVLRKNGDQVEICPSDNIARNLRSVLILDGQFHLLNIISGGGTCLVGLPRDNSGGKFGVTFECRLPSLLEGIQERDRDEAGRQSFDAIALNGALIRFKILSLPELRLLRFLGDLFPPHDTANEWRRKDMFTKAENSEPVFRPREMHVNGDRLTSIVDYGTSELRKVLGQAAHMDTAPGGILDVKTEQLKERAAEFKTVAVPVVGETDDIAGDVVKWLRALMRRT